MMTPTAIVKSDPVMTGEETQVGGMIRVRTYRMNISPAPDEPIKNFREDEPFTFVLTGEKASTECLTPGTPIHIMKLKRGPGGDLRGFGINLEQYGCCDDCEQEGTIQITPEQPGGMRCRRCVNRQKEVVFAQTFHPVPLE